MTTQKDKIGLNKIDFLLNVEGVYILMEMVFFVVLSYVKARVIKEYITTFDLL